LPKKESGAEKRLSQHEKETLITERRTNIMCDFMNEAIANFKNQNKGPLPE